ncbi:MAG: ribosome-binding factor A [Patescibacteria group bacterium]|jgi:ribosome-binding factor A
MPNIDRLNETLRKEIALAIEEVVDFYDGLITVSSVNCDPNFSTAKIYISVLPDNIVGSALEKLRTSSIDIAKLLKNRMRFRKVPKLLWNFDSTEKKVNVMNKAFEEMKKIETMLDEEIDKLEEVEYK